jgi:hypothetical protein
VRYATKTQKHDQHNRLQRYATKTKLSETVSKRRLSKRNPTGRRMRFTKMQARQIEIAGNVNINKLAGFKKAKVHDMTA